MYETRVNSIDGLETIQVYSVSDFDMLFFSQDTIQAKKLSYKRVFMTFDIETSTLKKYSLKRELESATGFMYIWQVCIDGKIIIGRRWEEFFELIRKIQNYFKLDSENRLVCYVHNLAYEFQFLLGFKEEFDGFLDTFAIAPRKPLKVLCGNGIEFRCSMRLTNMSLEKFTNTEIGVRHPKAKDDLDYNVLRTCDTELNEKELGYCINDVLGLWEAITMRLKNSGDDLKTIPLTSTGYVRKECRTECFEAEGYKRLFYRNRMDSEIYELLQEEFRGGNTHANRFYSAMIIESQHGESYDITSSYPFQCIRGLYPMTKFYCYGVVDSLSELLELGTKAPLLYRVYLSNIRVKKNVPFPYISENKCLALSRTNNYLADNGRVLCADYVVLTVNEIDMRIICRQYDFENIATGYIFRSTYGRYPEPLRKVTLYYFKLKTELKIKIKELENIQNPTSEIVEELASLKYEYAQAKARLNAIYGMSATKCVRPEIKIDEENNWEVIPTDIEEELEKYFKNYSSFMIYSWACWCTSYAREQLDAFYSMKGIKPYYCDTDSCKCEVNDIGYKNINRMNERIKKLADSVGAFVDVNNKRYYLGLWDRETELKPWYKFKTLGAKKYAYIDDDGLHVTISGVNKKIGASELKNLENFSDGFVFNEAGGNVLYYNNDPVQYIEVNGSTFLSGTNIGMVKSTYTLKTTPDYKDLIELNRMEVM